MSAVATDLNNLAADLNNDSLTGIAADGSSLYYDADTAWYDTLPSIDASDYQNAMNDYTRAGVYYSNADITDGNAYINAGSATFSNWTSAVTAAGSVCTGNEPNVTVSGPTPAATPTQAPLPAFECTYVTEVSSSSITLNIRGNGPDNAYAQATVKVVSGSWSQTVTIYRSSGWQSSRLQVGANAGDRCNVTTESAS